MANTGMNYDKSKHFYPKPGWTTEEMIEIYKARAPTYDQQQVYMVFSGSERIVKEVMEHFPDQKNIRIVDCGAGTGIIADKVEFMSATGLLVLNTGTYQPDSYAQLSKPEAVLREQGYMDIDGVDACQDMLDQAKKKGVYRRYICDLIGPNRLDIEDNTYDCTLGIGLVCPSQASTDCFPELIRITKPGGKIILCCRHLNIFNDPFLKENYEPSIQRLHDEGTWTFLKREILPKYLHDSDGILTVMEVK